MYTNRTNQTSSGTLNKGLARPIPDLMVFNANCVQAPQNAIWLPNCPLWDTLSMVSPSMLNCCDLMPDIITNTNRALYKCASPCLLRANSQVHLPQSIDIMPNWLLSTQTKSVLGALRKSIPFILKALRFSTHHSSSRRAVFQHGFTVCISSAKNHLRIQSLKWLHSTVFSDHPTEITFS